MTRRPLVIACGNPLRGDDGVGAAVVRRLGARRGATVRICLQYTPELAHEVAAADRVIFVDARAATPGEAQPRRGGVRVRRLDPRRVATGALSHTVTPESLLAMARDLYEAAPAGFLVTVAGARFDLGRGLSLSVRRLIPQAVRAVARLLSPRPRS